jgi:hypothetical protein
MHLEKIDVLCVDVDPWMWMAPVPRRLMEMAREDEAQSVFPALSAETYREILIEEIS